MQKVFETYAQRKGVQVGSLRFMLDGERIDPTQTPKMLELDDQDQIDCLLEQVGGGDAQFWMWDLLRGLSLEVLDSWKMTELSSDVLSSKRM